MAQLTRPNILEVAIDYSSHGYCVIPTIPGTKKTPIRWKEFQSRKPTEDELHRWFSSGKYNLAVVCGAISNCVVVDADSLEAITWVHLTLPPTPFVVATRKGKHFYYQHPGHHVQSKARKLADPPVDIRADGGLAQGFGSTHETGFIYHIPAIYDLVAPSDLPMYCPSWFPEADVPRLPSLSRPANTDLGAYQRAARYITRVPGAGTGIRNDSAFRLAACLVRDFALEQPEAEALMEQWNQTNDPPLRADEIRTIVTSAVSSGNRPIGGKL